MTHDEIVEHYLKCNDFMSTLKASKLNARALHIILAKHGVLKIKDKIVYGGKNAVKGAKCEEIFQQLVPGAIDANRCWRRNNPRFDFDYKGLTIDVKFSSKFKRGNKTPYWAIKAAGANQIMEASIICAFLERDFNTQFEDMYCLLIPVAFINEKKTLTILEGSEWFEGFQVNPKDLKVVLDEYLPLYQECDA